MLYINSISAAIRYDKPVAIVYHIRLLRVKGVDITQGFAHKKTARFSPDGLTPQNREDGGCRTCKSRRVPCGRFRLAAENLGYHIHVTLSGSLKVTVGSPHIPSKHLNQRVK